MTTNVVTSFSKPNRATGIVVTLLAVAVFINYVDRGAIATAAPLMKDALRLTNTQTRGAPSRAATAIERPGAPEAAKAVLAVVSKAVSAPAPRAGCAAARPPPVSSAAIRANGAIKRGSDCAPAASGPK